MMPGTVAQLSSGVATSKPEWVPADADGMLDFANDQYYLANQLREIGTMLGGGFDSSAISASGMYIDYGNSNRPTPIGVLLTRLLNGLAAGMTLVFEVSTASELGGFLLYIGVTPDYNDAFSWNYASIDGFMSDEGVLSLSASISGAGAHKIAVTFNRDVGGGTHEYAWSNDGNAALTQTTPYPAWTMSAAQLGWDGNLASGHNLFQTYIKSITFYSALDPLDLPALTA
ncbi:hypothetical protein [Mesorhizobium sp.]|uniref:hypothetical protein n=1 Tax=Mesorhizobium sp. TaxID=1871066 RepID=UPI000FE58A26|nr:hypothetical protein [Mesorhizobium sp.]RWN11747.1 MAG: hypothetical protein EOR87_14600 [Mesorhizobium sp.]RWN19466.1 MAG: hypothetical protein EOR88_09965 [Mesorhizobium sp.]